MYTEKSLNWHQAAEYPKVSGLRIKETGDIMETSGTECRSCDDKNAWSCAGNCYASKIFHIQLHQEQICPDESIFDIY